MEPGEMGQLVIETEKAWQSLGKVSYGMTSGEEKSRIYKRSLYTTRAFSFSKIAIARTFLPSMFGLVFNIN
jgi:sialic acid synthase SpsE